jgi:predicted XRE-type DNA-binding protein
MDPSFWMNLQSEYDNRMSSRTLNQSPHREINTRDIGTSYDSELADPIAKSVNNVFADLELPDAEQMLRKAHLVSKISELILNKRLNDAGAASLMGISKISLSKIEGVRIFV